jgi:hypothetical protein
MFMYQDTRVNSNLWENSKIVDEFPYNGDVASYFPTLKAMKIHNMMPIRPASQSKVRESDSFKRHNLFFGRNELMIDDGILFSNERTTEYLTLVEKSEDVFKYEHVDLIGELKGRKFIQTTSL